MLNNPLDPPDPHPNRDLWAKAQEAHREQARLEREQAPRWRLEVEIDSIKARRNGEPQRTPTG
jgi:hypothetical protein